MSTGFIFLVLGCVLRVAVTGVDRGALSKRVLGAAWCIAIVDGG